LLDVRLIQLLAQIAGPTQFTRLFLIKTKETKGEKNAIRDRNVIAVQELGRPGDCFSINFYFRILNLLVQ